MIFFELAASHQRTEGGRAVPEDNHSSALFASALGPLHRSRRTRAAAAAAANDAAAIIGGGGCACSTHAAQASPH